MIVLTIISSMVFSEWLYIARCMSAMEGSSASRLIPLLPPERKSSSCLFTFYPSNSLHTRTFFTSEGRRLPFASKGLTISTGPVLLFSTSFVQTPQNGYTLCFGGLRSITESLQLLFKLRRCFSISVQTRPKRLCC